METIFAPMYRLPYFTENNGEEILQFMKQHPFVTLIGIQDGMTVATQIPVLIAEKEGRISLRGHIMRQTDHYKGISANPQAMILFTGPHGYVSASWYTERGHGSTWNYMSVQASGSIQFLDDDGAIEILTLLTSQFERDQKNPELVDGMTEQYIRSNVKAIAGFEMVVEDIKATFKLSQNRDDASYRNIIRELEATADYNARAIAHEMKTRKAGIGK